MKGKYIKCDTELWSKRIYANYRDVRWALMLVVMYNQSTSGKKCFEVWRRHPIRLYKED